MPFKDITKIQINTETHHVHLAVKISDNHVHNLVFSLESFTHIMSKDVEKWFGQIHGRYWELQKLSDRVKLFSESYEFHYRFDLIEWETIRRQFVSALRKNNLA
jgi:hypothetical protein